MIYPERMAHEVYKFAYAVSHMLRGVDTKDLPDIIRYSAEANMTARQLIDILREVSELGEPVGEIILAQIKEYYDATEIKNIGCDGDTTRGPRV